jgi:hypothetical protein
VKKYIISNAMSQQCPGEDVVNDVRQLFPDLSRGELDDAFQAAAEEIRTWNPYQCFPDDRTVADSMDERAWGILSRDPYPPPPPPFDDDPADPMPF